VNVYYDVKVKNQALNTIAMENVGPFKTRREEYADATREALVIAAGELFTSEGYQQVGIEAIARKARVTRRGVLSPLRRQGRTVRCAGGVAADRCGHACANCSGGSAEAQAHERGGFARFLRFAASPLTGSW